MTSEPSVVIIKGKEYELDKLPADVRKKIAIELNRRALNTIGYVEVTDEDKTA